MRENRFVIMLTRDERQQIDALARLEKLPSSVFARRRLLFEAEQRCVLVHRGEKDNRDGVRQDMPIATAA